MSNAIGTNCAGISRMFSNGRDLNWSCWMVWQAPLFIVPLKVSRNMVRHNLIPCCNFALAAGSSVTLIISCIKWQHNVKYPKTLLEKFYIVDTAQLIRRGYLWHHLCTKLSCSEEGIVTSASLFVRKNYSKRIYSATYTVICNTCT